MNELQALLDAWWADFRNGNRSAEAAYQLLLSKEGVIVHDHIALRTFADGATRIDTLMTPLLNAGYACKATYAFPKTRVAARHYEHDDPTLPKVFISELALHHFTDTFQAALNRLLAQIPSHMLGTWKFFETARPWQLPIAVYETLKKESEYAAWVSAFGFRPTHFAVETNRFTYNHELTTLNRFLKEHGLEFNTTGGEIQGSPDAFLEQSSLKATETAVKFTDGVFSIPGTYYEFAKRYSMPDGGFFTGFITASAENLFQSTSS